jgi:hypothetical protein
MVVECPSAVFFVIRGESVNLIVEWTLGLDTTTGSFGGLEISSLKLHSSSSSQISSTSSLPETGLRRRLTLLCLANLDRSIVSKEPEGLFVDREIDWLGTGSRFEKTYLRTFQEERLVDGVTVAGIMEVPTGSPGKAFDRLLVEQDSNKL